MLACRLLPAGAVACRSSATPDPLVMLPHQVQNEAVSPEFTLWPRSLFLPQSREKLA